MPWTVFDKKAATASKSPMVTIQKGGHFSLNKAAYHAVGEPEAVEILFDPEERLIGFRPASPESPRSFPVKGQGREAPTTFMVAGQAFAKYNQLDVSIARRYGVKVDEDGILVLDLQGPSIDVTGPRATMKSRLADRELAGNDKATKQA